MNAVLTNTYPLDKDFQDFFLGAVREARTRRDSERKETSRDHFYVSEVGTVIGDSSCDRKSWYAFNDAPKDSLPDETLMAFEVGDVIGLRVANIIAGTGKVEKVEVRLDFPGYPVTGRLDALTIPALKRVVEVKTIPVEQQPYIPKEDHIRQVNLYTHRVRQTEGFEDYNATLAYVFKNARKGQPIILPFSIRYDEAMAHETLDAFAASFQIATGEQTPPRPAGFTRTKWPCGYCTFQTHCWSGSIVNPK